jgi:hypothetical protein
VTACAPSDKGSKFRLDGARACIEASVFVVRLLLQEVKDLDTALMPSMSAPEGSVLQHPYYPIGVALSGGTFVPNDWSVSSLVVTFAVGLTIPLAVTFLLAKKACPNLSGLDQALVLWFVLSKSGLFVSLDALLFHSRIRTFLDICS